MRILHAMQSNSFDVGKGSGGILQNAKWPPND